MWWRKKLVFNNNDIIIFDNLLYVLYHIFSLATSVKKKYMKKKYLGTDKERTKLNFKDGED